MKLKYLLASGLFLSTAFVACTNDEFEEISAPVANAEDAIALGEGFAINVNKGGVDTRSAFDKKLLPYWEEKDELGAAWVHMVTDFDEETQLVNENPDGSSIIGSSYGNFYSNHPFVLSEGAGTNNGTFTSVTNAFTGAYVLYYPYNPEVATTGEEIPVGIKTYTADCENPLVNPSENMFSYSPAKFIPGGPRTGEFTLGQIPVLVELKFNPTSKLNHDLTGGIKINNIVVEAKDADGKDLLVSAGHIVADKVPHAANYNGTNGADLSEIVKYEYVQTCENLFITLENSDADEFKLMVKDQPTEGSFIFSMLPLKEKAAKVVFKVVTDRGVFSTTYGDDPNEADKLRSFNGTDEENGAAYEGGQVRMVVDLDVSEEDDVIYTADEFMERWAEACQTNASNSNQNLKELQIGTNLTLTEPLVCDDSNYRPNIKVTGNYTLTVPSIEITKSYGIEFDGVDLNVVGDVFSSGASTFNADNLSARNITIEGQGNVTLAGAEKLTVTSSAVVRMQGVDTQSAVKSVVIEEGNGSQGSLTYGGKLAINDLQSAETGKFVLDADFTNYVGNVMYIGDLDLNGKTLNNNGTVTLNGTYTSDANSRIVNKAGATLNVNKKLASVKLENEAGGTVNVLGELTATSTAYTITNDGNIYVYGVMEEKADNALTSNGNIYAATEDARIKFPKTNTTKLKGYVVILKDANVTNGKGEVLAYDLKDAADASQVLKDASGINTLLVNTELNASVLQTTGLNTKNLRFYKDLTLDQDLTLKAGFLVAGVVTVKSTDRFTLTLAKDEENQVLKGAILTINKGVTLNGDNSGTQLDVYGHIIKNGVIGTNLTVSEH